MAISAAAIAAITGGLNIAQNLIGASGMFNNAQANYEYSKELQRLQQEYQTEMWNKTNQYNTPQAQISRLRAAGLNPLSGEMSGSSAQTVSAPNGSVSSNFPSGNNLDLSSIFSNIMSALFDQSKAKGQDISNKLQELHGEEQLRSQILKNQAEAENLGIETEFMRQSFETRMKNLDLMNQKTEAEYQESLSRQRLNLNQIDVNNARVQIESKIADSNVKLNEVKMQDLWNQMKNRNASTQLGFIQANIQKALASSQIRLNGALREKAYSEKGLNDANADQIKRMMPGLVDELSNKVYMLKKEIDSKTISNEQAVAELRRFYGHYFWTDPDHKPDWTESFFDNYMKDCVDNLLHLNFSISK